MELFFNEEGTHVVHSEEVFHRWLTLLLNQVDVSQYESCCFLSSLLSSEVRIASQEYILQEVYVYQC